MKLHLSTIPSPLGDLLLVVDAAGRVRALDFADHQARLRRGLRGHYGSYELAEGAPPPMIAAALAAYFAGQLDALRDIATATGGTDFERRVWPALLDIPPGQTTSYGRLARALGLDDPRAAIDVGAAVGANPIDLIVPCHRVIGSKGELKGYAGGAHRKRWLLEHEGAWREAPAPAETARLPGF